MVFLVKSILFVVLVVFAVAGICEFIYMVKMFLHFPNTRTNSYLLVFLKKGFAIKQIDYFWQKILWHGEEFSNGIVAIADDIDELEFITCENYIKDKNIVLYRTKTLL